MGLFHVELYVPRIPSLARGEQFGDGALVTIVLQVRPSKSASHWKTRQHLAASSARSHGLDGIRDDGDGFKLRLPGSHRSEDRRPLGADGQAEGQVLHVAAAKDASARRP